MQRAIDGKSHTMVIIFFVGLHFFHIFLPIFFHLLFNNAARANRANRHGLGPRTKTKDHYLFFFFSLSHLVVISRSRTHTDGVIERPREREWAKESGSEMELTGLNFLRHFQVRLLFNGHKNKCDPIGMLSLFLFAYHNENVFCSVAARK